MPSHAPVTQRVRRRFTASQQIPVPRNTVFPLLCPVREYDWIPDWECRLVYTASGVAESGCVFQTDREADGGLDTWVVSHYAPPRRIGFVRVNPLRVIQYDIRLESDAGDSTILTWEQVITALSEEGDRHVDGLEESDFTAGITKLEELLKRYLESGQTAGA